MSMEKRVICCWGDSVTEGMRMDKAHTYPAQLKRLLGEKYEVFNGGSGGERTETIMARRGAREVLLSRDVVFGAGENCVRLGNTDDSGFVTEKGDNIRLTAYLGMELPVNPVKIADQEFTVSYENWNWTPISGDFMLSRSETGAPLTIPAGTRVYFNNAARKSDVDIVFMGANGGWGTDPAGLVSQYETFDKACARCLMIVPYFRQDMDELFDEAFGDRAVNVRAWFCSQAAFDAAGLEKTAEDDKFISEGRVPPAFTLTPGDVHLNEKGYEMLALLLMRRMKKLGWAD